MFTCAWTNVILDFMIQLLSSNDSNIVLIILINPLIKEKYYILYITNENDTIAKTTTYLFLNNI